MPLFLPKHERIKRDRTRRELEHKASTLLTTTADLKQDYDILTVLKAESLSELKMNAATHGADALVGVGFYGYDERCYGTAVRFRISVPEQP
ncbi:hypothetical protein JXQ70_12075 [bacterium]|nr:hypothetical protein [bacterium]